MATAETLRTAAAGDNSVQAFDVERVRGDFPVLQQRVHGKPLTYLDSGASAPASTNATNGLSSLAFSATSNAPTARNRAQTTNPSQTTWATRIRTLVRTDGPLAPAPCASVSQHHTCDWCDDEAECDLKTVWGQVRDAIAQVMDSTSLGDVLRCRLLARSDRYVI